MKSKNRYYSRSKITEAKFRQIIRFFSMDFTATDTAILTNISLRSINSIFIKIRKRIATECENISPFTGVVELDESYFGARRIRGKRGRGASGKTIVFGLLKREGNVYTEVVPDCTKPTLQGIIRGHIELETIINTDGWRGYDGLVDIGFNKHLRVNHGQNEFACGERHINGIESFWGYAKKRLIKFNGIDKKMFYLHLKETEYRFNHRHSNLYLDLLKLLRENPL
ncbi:MAG: IS1595 family transposase [Candidatus Acinetobacter avistercoris]|uniref:IS1595 family transposase n=1 Tax=Acinetobacter sp. KS-LM10 TaxID=3120518 RepID=UPI001F92A71A|nr:IS1595 family transposase [Candidatus Acinetobacter avistercoris]